jgi:hypothetical protein
LTQRTKAKHESKRVRSTATMSRLQIAYGKSASDALFWSILNAKNQLTYCDETRRAPGPPLMLQLFRRAYRTGHDWIALGFFERAAEAIKAGNAQFFKETARLLEQEICGGSHHKMESIAAACLLTIKALKQPTTKRELRQMCLRWRALQIVYSRLGRRVDKFHHFPPGGGQVAIRPSAKAEVEKEFARLKTMDANRTWNWTQIFKRVGASELPADKGGQPTHKRTR